jgi:hypothetical protein
MGLNLVVIGNMLAAAHGDRGLMALGVMAGRACPPAYSPSVLEAKVAGSFDPSLRAPERAGQVSPWIAIHIHHPRRSKINNTSDTKTLNLRRKRWLMNRRSEARTSAYTRD